jgi:hypothetical protein
LFSANRFLWDISQGHNLSDWEAGANATASAKTKTEGGVLAGAVTVSKGVKMFYLNDEGAIVGESSRSRARPGRTHS